MSLQELKKKRVAARGWMARTKKRLEELMEAKSADSDALQAATADCQKRLEILDGIQLQVELGFDSEAEMLEDIESAASLRESVTDVLAKASKVLNSDRCSTGGSVSASDHLKLPKLELPKFDGSLLDWQAFWECFEASVHKSDLPDVTKFAYLRSLLAGEALDCVAGLSLSAANYGSAVELLKGRFGRKEVITFSHIQQLLSIPQIVSSSASALRTLQDRLLIQIRSLESLEVGGDKYGVILVPLILSKLPTDVRLEWAREGSGREADLTWLMNFLSAEIERRERSTAYGSMQVAFGQTRPAEERHQKATSGPQQRRKKTHQGIPAAAALLAGGRVQCGFCGQSHSAQVCHTLKPLSVPERKDAIRSARLCFKCLKSGHVARRCGAVCDECGGQHSVVCCFRLHGGGPQSERSPSGGFKQGVKGEAPKAGISQVSQNASLSCVDRPSSRVLLPTAKVHVHGPKGVVSARLVLDSGSQKTFVSESLVRKVGAEFLGSKRVNYTAFGGSQSDEERGVYKLTVSGANLSRPTSHSFSAIQVPLICPPLSRPSVPSDRLQGLAGFELADHLLEGDQLTVDILCGLDVFWTLVKPGAVQVSSGLAIMDSVFGWVLSGVVAGETDPPDSVCSQFLTLGDLHETTVRSLWDLEVIGIGPKEDSVENHPVLQDFEKSIQFNDETGRYKVKLPWKADIQGLELRNGEQAAEKRLDSLNRKLDRDPELKVGYEQALHEMEENGVIQEIHASDQSEADVTHPVFYLPHRPVVRESSVSTRIRPVFDASARDVGGVSLNDCLHIGPPLTPNVCDVLCRFRRHQVAVVADISKAFLNIELHEQDADVQRFLWDVNGQRKHMKVGRVLFGISSSPFLLNATIRHHLSQYQPPSETVTQLQDQLFVDDFLGGSDTEEGAWRRFCEARNIMAEAGMPLVKCTSNSKLVFDRAQAESVSQPQTEALKVLGVRWSCEEDCFRFDGVPIPDGMVTTKRVVLSCIARFFEPLGLLAPFLLKCKCLFQELWKLGLDWDEPVPPPFQEEFVKWVRDLQRLREVKIPRCFVRSAWSDVFQKVEIHGYGDASEKGYGGVIYLRCPDESSDKYVTSLVMSKVRVAPLRKVTLPRLELLAALLVARLVSHVMSVLRLPESCEYRCWSDSQVALAWIRGDPGRWKQFVANRVTEIQQLTDPQRWSYCPSAENPADILSRGASADQLLQSDLWFNGPPSLRESAAPIITASGEEPVPESDEVSKETKPSGKQVVPDGDEKAVLSAVLPASRQEKFLPFHRWGSFTKTIRVMGWVKRFVHNVRFPQDKHLEPDLSFLELSQAKHQVLLSCQKQEFPAEYDALQRGVAVSKSSSLRKLNPVLGEDQLIRVRSRLDESHLSFDEKRPVIIPKGHLAKQIVRFQHEKVLKHAGVSTLVASLRGTYWILGVRRLCKAVKKGCVACQRQDAKAVNEEAAPLPRQRVTQASPFSVTGVDFCGPVYCADFPGKSFYICLFTCAVTRAVHLELTDSLSKEDFLLAFRRFSARRSMPSTIYSDGAKTFRSADAYLRASLGPIAPEWRFNAPRSPWWGGWFERLVRSVKSALRKTLGKSVLRRSELETCLHEVEATVNSRPLTFVGDELDSADPLTPSHFLVGKNLSERSDTVEDPENVCSKVLSDRERLRRKLLDRFWKVWSDDYLRNLPPAVVKFQKRGQLAEGSVVLIHEDNMPRLRWSVGVVVKLHPGRDGLVRAVDVRTKKGIYTRAVQRLHNLELVADPSPADSVSEHDVDVPSVTEPAVRVSGRNNMSSVKSPEPYLTRYGRLVKQRFL